MKVHPQTRVNTYFNSTQDDPAVAALKGVSGGYVVTWTSSGQDGSGNGVFAQRFSSSGVALGPEFRVNTNTSSTQQESSVVGLSDGSFLVSWVDHSGIDGSSYGVYARRFDANGAPLGNDFRVNTYTSSDQGQPSTAVFDGGYVVTWYSNSQDASSYGVYTQRYNNAGVAQGAETRANTTTTGAQYEPDVSARADGSYVVVWRSDSQDGSGAGVYAQRFDSAGVAAGAEFLVNTVTASNQYEPRVAMLADGSFVVVWRDDGGRDGSGNAVFAQRYDAAGVAQGGEFRINEYTSGSQYQADVEALSGGGFVVTWHNDSGSLDGLSNSDVYVREYSSLGIPLAGEERVNTPNNNGQYAPAIADLGSGNFVVVFADNSGADGNGTGVFQQLFGDPAELPRQASPTLGDFSGTVNFGENAVNATAQVLDASVSLADADSTNFDGGRVSLFYVSGASAEDQLTVVDQGNGPGQIGLAGNVVSYGGVQIGTLSGGVNGANMEIALNANATVEAVEDLIQHLGYRNTSSSPQATRQVSVRIEDGDGGSGAGGIITVNVSRELDGSPAVHGEDRVNSYVPGNQNDPEIGRLSDGGYVTVWTSVGQDGSADGIYAQRHSASGVAVGPEWRVNTSTGGDQNYPHVAGLSDGGFVISWEDNGNDGSGWGSYAQRYDANGAAAGGQMLLNTTTANNQYHTVVSAYTGGFAAVWAANGQAGGGGYDILLQRFDNVGAKLGGEVLVNTPVGNNQQLPDVAAAANGDLVIVWQDEASADGNGYGVFGRRYDAASATFGTVFQVNTLTSGNQYEARVAMLSNGGFVAVWGDSSGPDGSGWATYARVYDAAGAALGDAFRVNEYTNGSQYQPVVTGLSTGGFVVAFHNDSAGPEGTSGDVSLREYDNLGNAIDGDRRVNSYTSSTQSEPAIEDLGNGNFVVAWRSEGQDGSSGGIYQQVFGDGAELARQANPDLGDLASTLTFAENLVNAAPQLLDAAVSLTDADSANFNGGRLDLFYTTGQSSQDQLSVLSQGNGAGQIGVAGNVVSYGGVAIGLLGGGSNGTNLRIDFNSDAATVDAVESLIQRIAYANTSSSPDASRTLGLRVSDGDGGASLASSLTINVTREIDGTPTAYGEDRVNSYSPGVQNDPEIGRLSDGGYVTVWTSVGQDGSADGIYAQRYSASGVAVGPEWRVNLLSGNDQNYPHVAGLSDGGFVISWEDNGNDGSGWGSYAQRYDANGVAAGSQLLLNTTTSSNQYHTVVSAYTGGFAAVWASNTQAGGSGYDIVLQRFDNAGAKLGGEVLVNTPVGNNQQLPDVAASANGNLVIVWQDEASADGNGYGVFGRRYDAASATFGAVFQVNTITTGNQYEARVAMLSNGGFVVVYGDSGGQDGSGWATYARVYDADGTALGDAIRVNESTSGSQYQPVVTGLSSGGFVVSFYNDSTGPEGTYGDVYIREYDNLGNVIDGDRRVNSYTAGSYQYEPAIEDLGNGNFVVAWRSDTQDNGTAGIYQQLFGDVAELPRQLNPDLGNFTGTVTFAENLVNAGPQVIDAAVSLTDIDSANFNGGRLDLFYTLGQSSQDQLSVLSQGNGAGQIGVAGNVVSFGGVAIGLISGGSNGTNLRIDFNSDAATADAVEALVQRLAYANTSQSPNLSRGLGLRVSDGDGGSSTSNLLTINITPDADGIAQAYGEEHLNSYRTAHQQQSEVALLSDGGYVVTWQSTSQDGSSEGIYAQRFSAQGVAIGAEFRVNATTTGEQSYAHVAALSDGGFAITWQDNNASDGNGWGVFGQRYDATGTAQGGNFVVNTHTNNIQFHNAMAGYNGGFAVVWSSTGNAGGSGYDIYLKRYDNSGAVVTAETRVSTTPGAPANPQLNTQQLPHVAAYANGNLVIVWQDESSNDGSSNGVYGRRYDAASGTFSDTFLINTTTSGAQYEPQVATLADGGFIVVWRSDSQDGSSAGVYGQRYDAAGVKAGGEFLINETTNGGQYQPAVTGLSTGGFVVSWYNDNYDLSGSGTTSDVYIRQYDAAGVALDGQRKLVSNSSGEESSPTITDLGNGNFVVTYTDYNTSANGGNNTYDIAQQIFGDAGELARPSANPLLDDLRTTRILSQAQAITPQLIDSDFNVADSDSANLDVGRLLVFFTSGATANDTLSVQSFVAPLAGQFNLNGSNLYYGGTAPGNLIGTVSGGVGDTPLAIVFNASVTPELARAVAENITYQYNAGAAPIGSRTIAFRLFDGDGGASEAQSVTLSIAASAPAAVLALSDLEASLTLTEASAQAGVLIDSAVQLDAGVAGFNAGTLTVSYTANARADDQLTIRNQGNGSGEVAFAAGNVSYEGVLIGTSAGGGNGSSLVVTFNASATADAIERVIENLRYQTTSDGALASRTVQIQVRDAAAVTTAQSIVINITPEVDGAGPLFGDQQVNTYVAADQEVPRVATLEGANAGAYVVVWRSNGEDGSGWGVFGQRYTAAGVPDGTEFQINSLSAGAQQDPQVAALSGGGFVVTWYSEGQDGSSGGVYAQRYGVDGNPAGTEFRANTTTTSTQTHGAVLGLAGGGFIITWASQSQDTSGYGVFGQRYDAAGAAVGVEFQLNTYLPNDQYTPAMAALRDDPSTAGTDETGFVAVWISNGQDGSGWGVYGQRFDAAGAKVGTEFKVNTTTTGSQYYTDVATLANGDFVVVWDDDGTNTVRGQRFTAGGATVGGEFAVNNTDFPSNYGRSPHIAALGNGGFVISWDGTGSIIEGGYGVYAQQYDAVGAKVDGPLHLSSITAPTQIYPDISGLSGSNFVAVWQSYNQEVGSASTYGVFSQLFGTPGSIVRQESPQLLDLEASVSFDENTVNAAPQLIDPGVRVIDGDSANFAGGKLIVSVINGYGAGQGFDPGASTQDHFAIRNQGAGAGQVGFDGSTVRFGGVAIGTVVSNGQNGSDLVVQWNASATAAMAEAVVENLTYRNSSSNPVASRQVSIVVSDGDGGQSTQLNTITINVNTQVDGAAKLLPADQRVNTYAPGDQIYAGIGALQGANAGQYVVVWQSEGQDSDGYGVFGQRYDVNGSAIGAEFQINTTTPGAQEGAQGVSIGALSTGGFVVSWEAPDGSSDGIFAQRYDAAGNAVGAEFKVSPVVTYEQTQAMVLGLAGGAFAIAWSDDNNADGNSYGVRVQHYDAAGVAQGAPVLINATPGAAPPNSFTNGNQSYPQMALLNDGGYVITYHSQGQDGSDWGVYARLMNADGTPRGDAFQVHTTTAGYQAVADVATLTGGDFVVTFKSDAPGLNGWSIMAQRFTAAGVKVGDEVLVNDGATVPISDALPRITALDTGGYVIAWHASSNNYDSFAQQFDALGNKVDAPLQLNSYNVHHQYMPNLASLGGGRFVAAWQSYNQEAGTANTYGIYQNLFGTTGPLAKSAAPEITDLVSSLTVGENAANQPAGVLIDAAVSVFDADSANFDGGQMVVSVISGYSSLGVDLNENLPSQDQFFIRNQGNGAGQVDVVGANVRYGGVTIGSILSDGSAGKDLIVQWNAAASQQAVEAVIENLSYRNISTDPVPSRIVSLQLSDGDGTTGTPRVLTINVTPEADGPAPLFLPERVNTYAVNAQQQPDVARLSDGGYVIVWESEGQDGWSDGVFGQRYDALGTPVGNEFRVSDYTPYSQYEPTVTGLAGGGFVVAFRSDSRDGSGSAVIAQVFDAGGARAGAELLVNTSTNGSQYQPNITALNDGGFAVAWYSDGIRDGRYYDVFFQRFNAAGTAVGSEVRANTSTGFENSAQYEPNIVQLSGGDIVVAWRADSAQDGSLSGVYAQRFSSSGVTVGGEFRLNTTTENYQYDVQLARHGTGFVAVWTSREQDGSADGIYGRLYDASGNPTTAEFRINESTYHYQYEPAVATLSGGGFVVTWHGYNQQTGQYDVLAQQFDAAGNRVDGETRLDNTTSNSGQNVTALANGAFVVAWQGSTDGDGTGIFQRLVGNPADFPRQSAPVLVDLATTVTFLENDLNLGPQRIDPGVGLFDSDSTNFAGGRLDVSYVTPYGNPNQFGIPGINAQDQLGIRNQGTGTAQIGVSGANVSYEGMVIGTLIANGVNGGALTVLFNANATPVAVEALVENLTYQNFLSNPEPSRTISVRISDGDGGVTAPQAVTINITPQSDGAVPLGVQQTVNTAIAGQQYTPSIARLSDNGYVVVWRDDSGADGSSYGVYGQRYDSVDNKVGAQFLVNTATSGAQYEPGAVALADGKFAVVWRSDNGDGSGSGVYMQVFAADGTKDGIESRVNTTTVGSQYQPAVTQSSTGGFIVAWYSDNQRDGQYYDTFFQRYDASGAKLGGEIRANTPISATQFTAQSEPSIALLEDGRFVVTWRSEGQDGSSGGIYAQRFNIDGSPDGSEQRLNTYIESNQSTPSVAALKDGGYVVIWRSEGQDTSSGGIYGQRFDATGTAVGGEFRVNYLVSGNQSEPTVASLVNGGFVVSWTDGDDLWLQQFDSTGRQVDSQLAVNANAYYDPKGGPDIVEMPDGGFVVAYHGYLQAANGGNDTWDIRLQRFANTAPNVQDVVVNGPEDTDIVLTEALFASGFSDAEGQTLAAIKLITLPASGTLKFNGADVLPGQEISAADLAAGLLVYKGNLNFYGPDQFRWTGSDGNVFASGSVFTNITLTNVNDGPGLEAGVDGTANEGTNFSRGFTLSDPDPTDTHQITVSWVGNLGQTGSYQFSTGSATPSFNLTLPDNDTYTVTLTADDQQGQPNSVETDTFQVVVANVAPTLNLFGDNTVESGQVYTLQLGGVIDPGADTETSYSIDWGDGTPPQLVNVADLPGNRQLTHTYATPGSFAIVVGVTDEDGNFPNAGTRNVTVSAPAEVITVDAGADTTAQEGVFFSRTINFTDPTDQDPVGRTVTVDWGDGSAPQVFGISGAATSFNIGHYFTDNRVTPFEVSVTVDDSGAQQGNDKFLVTVNDVAPTLSVFGAGSVSEGSNYLITLGGVNDSGTDVVSEYRIHWGDGSTVIVAAADMPANRQFSHVYADGNIGGTPRSVTVDLVNEDGTFLVAGQHNLTVLNVVPVVPLSGANTSDEGSSYALTLGALTDPGTDTATLFRLNWGDGSAVQEYTPAEFAALLAGGGVVNHVFADGGNGGTLRTIVLQVLDEDGTHTAGTKSVTVGNLAPTLTLTGADNSNEASGYTLNIAATDAGGAGDPLSYSIDWGDGSLVQNLTAGQLAALGGNVNHVFADDNDGPDNASARSISVTVNDGDGGSTSQIKNIAVLNVAPTAPVTGADSVNETSVYTLNVGAVADPGPDTRTGYSIAWGDGATDNFTVAQWTAAAGVFTHTYADGAAGGTGQTITVNATDEDGTFVLGSKNITVNNVGPVLNISGAAGLNEGGSYTLNIVGSDVAGAADPLSYSIDWGDGSALQNLTAAELAVLGGNVAHVYADDDDGANNASLRSISVTVNDGDGGTANQVKDITVSNVAPTAAVTGDDSVNEASLYTLNVGPVSEPGTDTRSGYSIDWGDGSTSNFTAAQWAAAAGSFSHAYADGAAGGTAQAITVSATDEDGTFVLGTKNITVNNVGPVLNVSGADSLNEGGTYTLNIVGSDAAGAADPLSYSIDWGDGSAVQNLTAAELAALGGNVQHVFADDQDGPVNSTARNISVTATDGDGGSSNQVKGISVDNVAPTIALSGAATVQVGLAYTLNLGAVADPGTDTVTSYLIDWGDGNTEAVAAGGDVNHIYATTGNRTIVVGLVDEDGSWANAGSLNVEAVAATPTVSFDAGSNVSLAEGALFTRTVNFGDGDDNGAPGWTYSIDYGDGTIVNGSTPVRSVDLSHVFADGVADHVVSLTITDEAGESATDSFNVHVDNLAPSAVVSGADSVNEASLYTLNVGAVTDPGADTRTGYSIDWGDGSTSNFTVAQWAAAAGSFSHSYADGAAGGTTQTITVSASDEDGIFVLGAKNLTVNNVGPSLNISGAAGLNEGGTYTLSIAGSDAAGAADPLSYSIDWGDGTAVQNLTAAELALLGGNVQHVYADDDDGANNASLRSISVTVNDGDGGSANQVKDITVSNVAPTAAVTGDDSVNEASLYTLNVGAVNDPGTDTRSGYSIAWGDGATDVFTAAQWAAAAGSFSHSYADGASGGTAQTITVSATDEDGTFVLGTKNLTVNNVAPLLNISGADSLNEGGSYTLSIVGSDAAGAADPLSYSIDWGDGSALQNLTAAELAALGGNVQHLFADDQDGPVNSTARNISVTANDGDGGSANQVKGISVNNVAPTIALSGAASATAGQTYALNLGAVTDPGQDTVSSYIIDWGDGTTQAVGSGGNVNHVFGTAGNRTVSVSLVDEDGTWANAGNVQVAVGGGQAQTVRIGNAPTRETGAGGQWQQAWTHADIALSHKADITNGAEAWSTIALTGASPQTLPGLDVFAGDLGVSGQSVLTSSVRQEVDGKEGLRFTLDQEATQVTMNLSRFFINDDGTVFTEGGLLRLLDGNGQVVGETVFAANSASGNKQVTLSAAAGFVAVELMAGGYHGTEFNFGSYVNPVNGLGSTVYTDANGVQHGSDFLVDWIEFQFAPVGVPLIEVLP